MIEIEAPDGSVVEFPDGTPDDAIKAALAKTFGAPQQQSEPMRPRQSMAGGIFDRFTQEAAFGFGDELTGLEAGLLGKDNGRWFDYSRSFGDRRRDATQAERERLSQFAEDRPVTSAVAGLGGAVASGGGLARGGLTLMRGGMRLPAMIGAGAAEGAAYGATSGAGHADDGSRIAGAMGGGITGAALGGAAPAVLTGIGRLAPPASAPTLEALQGAKTAAYRTAEQTGARYSPEAFARLTDDLLADATARNLNPTRHPRAASMLQEIKAMRDAGESPTLTQLDQLRQVIRRDVASVPDEAERFFGGRMISAIDDFIANADQSAMAAGSADDAQAAITAARDANSRFRRAETVEDALGRADLRAASTGSGGNVENAMRQNIRSILDNPRKRQGFSREELDAMEAFVRGSRTQNVLRQIGKMSPQGNGLMGMLGVGGTFANPAFVTVPAMGFVAKQLADRNATNMARTLSAQIRRGAPAAPNPGPLNTEQRRLLVDALAAYTGGGVGSAVASR